jgi:hypothetical protein
MDMQNRVRMMELSIERLLKTNNAADAKVATVVGMNTTMLAVLAAIVTSTTVSSGWLVALAVLSAVGMLAALFCLSLSSFPRTSRPAKSVIFFGAIAGLSTEVYGDRVKSINEEEYIEDLIDQCHRTATIATRKFRWIQRGQMIWYASIIPWLLTVYMVYHR